MPVNLIDTNSLKRTDVIQLFKRADFFRASSKHYPVQNNTIGGLLFFEASTRTRVGFEAAAWKLGIKTILINETKFNDKMSTSESISDTIKTLDAYVSFFCIRHPDDDIFKQIIPHTKHPIINCGNGNSEHPTQALIDAYSIWTKFGRLDRLNVTIVGNPRFTRSTHSLVKILSIFKNIRIEEFCDPRLSIEESYVDAFIKNTNNVYASSSQHIWGLEDIVYVTGFPPISPAGKFSQRQRDKYKISSSIAKKLKDKCIILDPLPRIDEIDTEVDQTKHAYYFEQNKLGLFMRMAILERYCLNT